jgi:hypothetical protein
VTSDLPLFPPDFDQVLSGADGSSACFGRDVLSGLVDGLRREQRARAAASSEHLWGTGVLGCAMWMDDPDLLEALTGCESACIVVTKQPRGPRSETKYQRLREFAENAQGVAQVAFTELEDLALAPDNQPLVVGPYGPRLDADFSPVRELGFRRVGNRLVPIVHAKITASSRRSLEMGMWTTDPQLLKAARRFLLGLIAASEPLGAHADDMSPEMLPVEYDAAAMVEAMGEMRGYDSWD